MPRARDRDRAAWARLSAGLAALCLVPATLAAPACSQPVYLTFDTGHMGVAPLIAQVLREEQVQVTFFAANERTQAGGWSLDDQWASWWRERAAEGHQLATHTWDHWSWLADHPDGSFDVRPSMGPSAGQRLTVTPAQYCAQLKQPVQRLGAITGQPTLPLFRAPGGKTSPNLLRAAQSCGFAHVGWADAGFLGDELPSERYPNEALLKKALARIRPGDILVAHLGIWSRRDPWAPAVLKPLIRGLKAKGLCFATLADHPQYRAR